MNKIIIILAVLILTFGCISQQDQNTTKDLNQVDVNKVELKVDEKVVEDNVNQNIVEEKTYTFDEFSNKIANPYEKDRFYSKTFESIDMGYMTLDATKIVYMDFELGKFIMNNSSNVYGTDMNVYSLMTPEYTYMCVVVDGEYICNEEEGVGNFSALKAMFPNIVEVLKQYMQGEFVYSEETINGFDSDCYINPGTDYNKFCISKEYGAIIYSEYNIYYEGQKMKTFGNVLEYSEDFSADVFNLPENMKIVEYNVFDNLSQEIGVDEITEDLKSYQKYVNDKSGLLTVDEINDLNLLLEKIEQDLNYNISVVIIDDVSPLTEELYVETYAEKLSGSKGTILLAFVMDSSYVAIVTNDYAEGYLIVEESTPVIQDIIIPKFKEQKYYEGINEAVLAISKELE